MTFISWFRDFTRVVLISNANTLVTLECTEQMLIAMFGSITKFSEHKGNLKVSLTSILGNTIHPSILVVLGQTPNIAKRVSN